MKKYLMLPVAVLACAFTLGGQAYGAHGEAQGKINVNAATKEELAWFFWRSGIGDSVQVAENTIEYRETNGPFRDIDELGKVKGINDYGLNQIRLWVKVEGESDYKPEKEESPGRYPYPGTPVPRDGASKGNFPEDEPYGPWRPRP